MRRPLPRHLRELRAQMELKNLDLREVARISGLAYTRCSSVLSGYVAAPDLFEKVKAAIEGSPVPEDAALA